MGEFPSDPPTVAAIELDRRYIRLNDAKMQVQVPKDRRKSHPLLFGRPRERNRAPRAVVVL
jgi:hypothetical protein